MENKRGLKSRSNLSTAIQNDLLEGLKQLSKETRIPMSKLLDESIQDLINKHKNNPSTK